MNVTIIYFSQTGNTRKVAKEMAKVFDQTGHITRTIPLNKATTKDATTCNLLGIGTPCFSSQAPTPIKKFLNNLSSIENKKAFVFATSGGAPGRVLCDLTRLLQNKGAEVVGGFLTRGELYHPAPCLIGRMSSRPDEEDLAGARDFANAVSKHISAKLSGPVVGSRPDTFKPSWKFYNFVAILSTDRFLRWVLPEPKLNIAQCNKCEWCILECPMHNITLDPLPVLGDKCIRCYRCLTGCPQEAFAADWRFGNLVVLFLYNTVFERWFGDLQPGERIYSNDLKSYKKFTT